MPAVDHLACKVPRPYTCSVLSMSSQGKLPFRDRRHCRLGDFLWRGDRAAGLGDFVDSESFGWQYFFVQQYYRRQRVHVSNTDSESSAACLSVRSTRVLGLNIKFSERVHGKGDRTMKIISQGFTN
jgi:uncharacterized membrane-anchored protein